MIELKWLQEMVLEEGLADSLQAKGLSAPYQTTATYNAPVASGPATAEETRVVIASPGDIAADGLMALLSMRFSPYVPDPTQAVCVTQLELRDQTAPPDGPLNNGLRKVGTLWPEEHDGIARLKGWLGLSDRETNIEGMQSAPMPPDELLALQKAQLNGPTARRFFAMAENGRDPSNALPRLRDQARKSLDAVRPVLELLGPLDTERWRFAHYTHFEGVNGMSRWQIELELASAPELKATLSWDPVSPEKSTVELMFDHRAPVHHSFDIGSAPQSPADLAKFLEDFSAEHTERLLREGYPHKVAWALTDRAILKVSDEEMLVRLTTWSRNGKSVDGRIDVPLFVDKGVVDGLAVSGKAIAEALKLTGIPSASIEQWLKDWGTQTLAMAQEFSAHADLKVSRVPDAPKDLQVSVHGQPITVGLTREGGRDFVRRLGEPQLHESFGQPVPLLLRAADDFVAHCEQTTGKPPAMVGYRNDGINAFRFLPTVPRLGDVAQAAIAQQFEALPALTKVKKRSTSLER